MINAAYNKISNQNRESDSYSTISSNESIIISKNSQKFEFIISLKDDNVNVEYSWTSKTKPQEPLPFEMIQAIIDEFPNKCFSRPIDCFTEIRKETKLYCADDNYRNGKHWYDNVLISWKSPSASKLINHQIADEEETRLVPAQLRLFFSFDTESTIYCLIHSCHYRNEKLSVLSSIWMKEYIGIPVSSFSTYRHCTCWKNSNNLVPVYRIVECNAIHSNCLLIPHHSSNCYVIYILHPDKWADEFFPIH